MGMLIIILILTTIIYVWWYNSPQQKGKRGEAVVSSTLRQLPEGYYVFNDVVIRTERGTTQIDHIVVARYGIFAIETKNYRGEIYGDDNRQQWTQIIVTKVRYRRKWKTYTYVTKNQFYNPVKQSLGHVYEIKKHLPEWPYLKVIPIVTFTGSANLSNVESNNHVIYNDDLLTTILQYKTAYLSNSDVESIVNHLSAMNIRQTVNDRTHIRNIKAAKSAVEKKLASNVCPRCGGTLIQRSGRYGSFYGCSNYPKCKFTTH